MKNNFRRLDDKNYKALFEEFKINFNKVYASEKAEAIAFANFITNTDEIDKRNAQNSHVTLKMNGNGDQDFSTRKPSGASQEKQNYNNKARKHHVYQQKIKHQSTLNNTRNLQSFYAGEHPMDYNYTCNFTGCFDFNYKPISQLPQFVNHSSYDNYTEAVKTEDTCKFHGYAYAYANLFEFLLYENTTFTNFQEFSEQAILDGLKYFNFSTPSDLCTTGVGAIQSSTDMFAYMATGARLADEYDVDFDGVADFLRYANKYNIAENYYFWQWDFDQGNMTQFLNQLAVRPIVVSVASTDMNYQFYWDGIISNCDQFPPALSEFRSPDNMALAVGYDLSDPDNQYVILKRTKSLNNWLPQGYVKIKIGTVDLVEGDWGECSIFYQYDTLSWAGKGTNGNDFY